MTWVFSACSDCSSLRNSVLLPVPRETEQMAARNAASQYVVHQRGNHVLFIGAMQSGDIKRVVELQSLVCLDQGNPKLSEAFFVHGNDYPIGDSLLVTLRRWAMVAPL